MKYVIIVPDHTFRVCVFQNHVEIFSITPILSTLASSCLTLFPTRLCTQRAGPRIRNQLVVCQGNRQPKLVQLNTFYETRSFKTTRDFFQTFSNIEGVCRGFIEIMQVRHSCMNNILPAVHVKIYDFDGLTSFSFSQL